MSFLTPIPDELEQAVSLPELKVQKRYTVSGGKLVCNYLVRTKDGEVLFWGLQTLNPFYTLKIHILDERKAILGEISYVASAIRCFSFQKVVKVHAPLGNLIGYLCLEKSLCKKRIKIYDEEDELLYVVNLGCCYSDIGQYKYKIFNGDDKGGGFIACKGETKTFTFSFPEGASSRDKLLIIFSSFYIVTVMTGHY
ncbi:UNVERIFIED_CONTAM: hypothetical protein RMT77_005067 [Armadillidium vulgare]|nr:hypothetical protein Avbf_15832 [Armadillidium vulgare]